MSSLISTRPGIALSKILPNAKILGADDIFVQSCCGLWQDCEDNDIFVAIVDAESDGHEFAREAIQRGATAIVTERLLSVNCPQCIVSDSRVAYGRICQALAGIPSQHLKTIGVSGSDGKTVTCHLIDNVLRAADKKTGLCSSIMVDLGGGKKPNLENQTQSATSALLADRLCQMAMADCDHAVLEISSISLAKRALDGITFDIGVLTNIRRANLDFHNTTTNYRRAQLRLLKQLKSSGVMVLNADDPGTHFLLPLIKQPSITIGIKQDAQVTAQLIERTDQDQTFLIVAGSDMVPVCTKIMGDQHIYNCLSAAAVGLLLGIDLALIGQVLSDVRIIPGRLEPVDCGQEFGIWIDSAKVPSQLATAIRAVKHATQGRVWCVGSAANDATPNERRELGEILERSADRVILTHHSIEETVDYESFHQMLDGCQRPGDVRLIPNRLRAIEWVLSNAEPGDGILIWGNGERALAKVGNDDLMIGDRDICESWLYNDVSLLKENWRSGLEDDRNANPQNAQIFNIDDYR